MSIGLGTKIELTGKWQNFCVVEGKLYFSSGDDIAHVDKYLVTQPFSKNLFFLMSRNTAWSRHLDMLWYYNKYTDTPADLVRWFMMHQDCVDVYTKDYMLIFKYMYTDVIWYINLDIYRHEYMVSECIFDTIYESFHKIQDNEFHHFCHSNLLTKNTIQGNTWQNYQNDILKGYTRLNKSANNIGNIVRLTIKPTQVDMHALTDICVICVTD